MGIGGIFGGIQTSSSGHLHSNTNSAHTLLEVNEVQNDSVFVHYSYAQSPRCVHIFKKE
jgi:hypothetical protein